MTYRDKAEYMKAHRMPQRSHSTGLVQDCLEILAPDEILKVPFIFIQILEVLLLLLSFLRIYTSFLQHAAPRYWLTGRSMLPDL